MFPGIRVEAYPGDAALERWRGESPYRFVVFPIGHAEWAGRAEPLRRLGWGLALSYRPVGPDLMTRAGGAVDARDAIDWCRWEGVPHGSVCFLDLHAVAAANCADYCRGWVGTLLDSGWVRPGICCVAADAAPLRDASRAEVHGATAHVPLWINGSREVDPCIVADIVEAPIRVMGEAHGGVALHVWHCRARRPDPSRPAGATALRDLLEGCLKIVEGADVAGADLDLTVRGGETDVRLRIDGRAGRR
jgi:hypothetical protein